MSKRGVMMNKHTGLFLTAIVAIVALVSIVMMSGSSTDVVLSEEDLVGMAPAGVVNGDGTKAASDPSKVKTHAGEDVKVKGSTAPELPIYIVNDDEDDDSRDSEGKEKDDKGKDKDETDKENPAASAST
jgi:hypothetical protein